MDIEIFALSRAKFVDLMSKHKVDDDSIDTEWCGKLAVISIAHSHEMKTEGYFKRDHENVLRLLFDDVSDDVVDELEDKVEARAMTEQQADEVIDFAQRVGEYKTIVVHCEAGISRSGAVAEFLSDYYGVAREEFKRQNPHVLPNQHVLKLLKDRAKPRRQR